LEIGPPQVFVWPEGDEIVVRVASCRGCGSRWACGSLSKRDRARVLGLRASGDRRGPYALLPEVLRQKGDTVSRSNSKSRVEKTSESNNEAVRAAALAFYAEHLEASAAEVLAHLEAQGFGSSRYPVATWRREAIAAQKAAENAPAEPKAKKKGSRSVKLAEMGDAELREHLLSHPQIPDSAWAGHSRQVRQREKGESRSDFIEAMLGS
jgi:hypothetical protein